MSPSSIASPPRSSFASSGLLSGMPGQVLERRRRLRPALPGDVRYRAVPDPPPSSWPRVFTSTRTENPFAEGVVCADISRQNKRGSRWGLLVEAGYKVVAVIFFGKRAVARFPTGELAEWRAPELNEQAERHPPGDVQNPMQ